MNNNSDFASQVGKIMIIVVAVIVAIWIAFFLIRLIGAILGIALPLIVIGAVIWFVYKVLMSENPKVG